VLDKYGATNPAEFLAVATECFFEKPRSLRHKHPELHDELKRFHQQEPAK
jgi:Mlc titration factor MtfA (ptsG expression regulator)